MVNTLLTKQSHNLVMGFNEKGTWLLYKLRSDFSPSEKIQTEDDISASIPVPRERINHLNPQFKNKSFKVLQNCEAFLFQRPDEAIIRGYDKQAEKDIITEGTFLTNYEKLSKQDAIEIIEDIISCNHYHFGNLLPSSDQFFIDECPFLVDYFQKHKTVQI